MAVRGYDENEEKKSYGSVFLLGTSLLVAVSLWSLWDDNITRRPWKKYQTEFYRLDYRKAKAAYDEENNPGKSTRPSFTGWIIARRRPLMTKKTKNSRPIRRIRSW